MTKPKAETEKGMPRKNTVCVVQYNYIQYCTRRIQRDGKTNREGNGRKEEGFIVVVDLCLN